MNRHFASDDDLLYTAACGDEAAFGTLMRRHRPWVRAVMAAFTRDGDQAEDLVQEAFCRLYRSAGSYAGRGVFVAYLKRIAVNIARDWLRAQKRAALLPLEEMPERPAEGGDFGPSAILENDLLREEMRAAVQSLPEEQRLAVIMRYYGEIPLADIAWAMRCPVGTVKSRLSHGLRRIRAYLTARWESE
ncbi:MAG: sigma-70 family RNA polymerase sigma factor [Armatimonadetes bacterium]|nr:sigma-70 family RNA polymerase sigma factor [Armatimonadota bacterium]